MPDVLLESPSLRAWLRPDLGASLLRAQVRIGDGFEDLIIPPASPQRSAMDCGLYLLSPWSNRIASGRFTFHGREVSLAPTFTDGSAIHGEARAKAWQMTDRSPISASCVLHTVPEPGRWPWALVHAVRYVIEETVRGDGPEVGLRIELSVTNVDDTSCPAGLGFHPFFAASLGGDRGRVRLPGVMRYPSVGQIPTGAPGEDELSRTLARGVEIGGVEADDVFVAPRWREASLAYGRTQVSFDVDSALSHAVVYAPAHGRFICLEPVTMANNAFGAPDAADLGVIELAPGEAFSVSCVIRVSGLWAADAGGS